MRSTREADSPPIESSHGVERLTDHLMRTGGAERGRSPMQQLSTVGERNVDSADEHDVPAIDPPRHNSSRGRVEVPPLEGAVSTYGGNSTSTTEAAGFEPHPSLAAVAVPPATSGVVWGEVVEYDYDIPEVEATEVDLDVGDAEHGDKGDDEPGDGPPDRGTEERKRNVSKWWTYVSVASTFIGMSSASQLMSPDLIDEDDVIGIAAIVNTGVTTAHAAAAASVPASGATATAAAGAGGVTATNTFASAAGIGSSSTK